MRLFFSLFMVMLLCAKVALADDFRFSLRSERASETNAKQYRTETAIEHWNPANTALIICDVWDAHHSLNAVRRLEEFAPRMNEVVKAARSRGATIIHSPSDCMSAYEGHPARLRAVNAPMAANLPREISFWCSRIPTEAEATYPIDQSDGGDDDDPVDHAPWAEKLQAMGRNPALPWKAQSSLIEIDADKDYLSDRGDEVWNVLEHRGATHVILVGVHTNMCVLGRPFGLRQMVRHGKRVVLMRDMTDCMYNSRRWPYVDHFTGNDLIVRHVERHVCPTITSDQILGGTPFVSKYDIRANRELPELPARSPEEDWSILNVPGEPSQLGSPTWYRCVIRLPKTWIDPSTGATLSFKFKSGNPDGQAWLNGQPLTQIERGKAVFNIPPSIIQVDDANLLVIRGTTRDSAGVFTEVPQLHSGDRSFELRGKWEYRIGESDQDWSNMPLPSKFGGSTDIYFEPRN